MPSSVALLPIRARSLLLAVALGAAALPAAAGKYTDQVNILLDRVDTAMAKRGFEQTHTPKIDKLRQGDSDSFSFTLKKGMSSTIVSVCDADCSDLDLVLRDEGGNDIDNDDQRDDMPIVSVQPKWTGKFTLRVKMYSCNNNPCYYGIGIYGAR